MRQKGVEHCLIWIGRGCCEKAVGGIVDFRACNHDGSIE
jgi:hypothetical protein